MLNIPCTTKYTFQFISSITPFPLFSLPLRQKNETGMPHSFAAFRQDSSPDSHPAKAVSKLSESSFFVRPNRTPFLLAASIPSRCR